MGDFLCLCYHLVVCSRYPGSMTPEISADIEDLKSRLVSIEKVLNPEELRRRVEELEQKAADPDLWNDQDYAQHVTSQLSQTQAQLRKMTSLRDRLNDLPVMYELAEEEDDAAAQQDANDLADAERSALRTDIESAEITTLLSGELDERDAVVNIRSGAGGVDAADFAEMLLRMYIRWAEKRGAKVDLYDTSYAEEAGIKSATFVVHEPYAYGTLSVEQGTHRLVRLSPFDNAHRRQTSFAEVEVLPVVEQTDHIDIPDSDIRVDVYHSSGPGGQSVNTTDSAVRITHFPTGIVVTCQNEKSQLQNKAAAMAVLQSRLLEKKRQEEKEALRELGTGGNASWGNQMRSYVLHPYQMVKDLRTGYEVNNPQAVLDGDIDGFLESGIRWRATGEADAQN